jgi:hypothetical protein
VGREVTFLRYQSLESPGTGPGIAEAVVQRAGGIGTRNVPVWILARDPAESFFPRERDTRATRGLL